MSPAVKPEPPGAEVVAPRSPRRTVFTTEMQVRPDDIDMNQHVHGSRYLDYVLAARYDQMARCYGMAMEEFIKLGYAWVIRTAHVDYRRPLRLGEQFVVRTWVETLFTEGVRVGFQILKQPTGKRVSDGWFDYVLISAATGRAVAIPDGIAARYAV